MEHAALEPPAPNKDKRKDKKQVQVTSLILHSLSQDNILFQKYFILRTAEIMFDIFDLFSM